MCVPLEREGVCVCMSMPVCNVWVRRSVCVVVKDSVYTKSTALCVFFVYTFG